MGIKSVSSFDSKTIFKLLIVNFIVRLLVMLFTNLGNDEVYYVQYALNPDIGHFDHPPLVGLLIRLSTFNLHFVYNDFFVRLGSLLVGTFNLYIIYKIGVLLKDKTLGLIAALICSSSIYASIIVGTFILPDTPLSFFWLLAIFAFIKLIANDSKSAYWLILFGIAVGFGLASKYQAIFLWVGAGVYFIIYDRKIFFTGKFWLSILSTLIIFSPVVYWNLTSEYSGINYHSERVGNGTWIPSLDNFFPEFFGQIFYNNPFNVFVIVISLIQLFKLKLKNIDKRVVFLLAASLPLIMLTLGMSLYSRTLPHWSGPSYFSLILIAGFC
jgi:4-amino-4-deoxy-L-arabinose transferase-like glycosyltransferase